MVKIFWHGLGETKYTVAWLSAITLDKVFASANMPLYPGAVRYYQEMGIKIPAELMPSM